MVVAHEETSCGIGAIMGLRGCSEASGFGLCRLPGKSRGSLVLLTPLHVTAWPTDDLRFLLWAKYRVWAGAITFGLWEAEEPRRYRFPGVVD
jgi:hypothetical protein